MTVPTKNNIPSGNILDQIFNAEKIDEVVNSDNETYQDRFGNSRFTLKGIFLSLINQFGSYLNPSLSPPDKRIDGSALKEGDVYFDLNTKLPRVFLSGSFRQYGVVKTVSELSSLNPLAGDVVYCSEYDTGYGVGGGYFKAVSTSNTSDNGTFFNSGNTLKWKRLNDRNDPVIYVSDYGARGSLGIDISDILQSAINLASSMSPRGSGQRITVVTPQKMSTSKTIFVDPSKVHLQPLFGNTEWRVISSGTYSVFPEISTDGSTQPLTIAQGGTGYSLNDVVTIFQGITAKVTSVSSGVVTGVSLLSYGYATNQTKVDGAQPTSGGTGTGLTVTINWSPGYAILFSSDLASGTFPGNTPQINRTKDVMSNIYIYEWDTTASNYSNSLNCFKWFSTSNQQLGLAELVSQTGMSDCVFYGFNTVMTNGSNGWGWSFFKCCFAKHTLLCNFVGGTNNQERIEFFACIGQNGVGCLNIINWTGHLNWFGGSIEYYSSTEFQNKGGTIQIFKAHIESHGRTKSMGICSTFVGGNNAILHVEGCNIVTLGLNGAAVNLFVNDRKARTIITKNVFTTDQLSGQYNNFKLTDSLGVIQHENHFYGSIAIAPIPFCQGNINAPAPSLVSCSFTGTGLSATPNGNKLVVSNSSSAGTAKTLTMVIPIVDKSWFTTLSAMIVLSASTSAGAIPLTFYGAIQANYQVKKDLIASALTIGSGGQTLIPANAAGISFIGYDCVIAVFDCANMAEGNSFTIDAIGSITY